MSGHIFLLAHLDTLSVSPSTIPYKTSLKLPDQIQWNFMGSFLGWPSIKKNDNIEIEQHQQQISDYCFCLKKHLRNYKAKIDETLQESSLNDSTKYNKALSFTTTTNNKMANFLFYFNKTSETTKPNSINLFRNLHCMILYKNATRHRDWPTTTTKWSTC